MQSPLAYRALQHELEIGLLMSCNVIVYEADDGRSVVAMLALTDNAALADLAHEARDRLTRVITARARAGV